MEPIQLGTIGSIGNMKSIREKDSELTGQASTGFKDALKNVWYNAADTQTDLAQKQYLQSIGEINDTHTVPIAASKAELSLSMLVNLRNKALDSYNELIKINV